jgi:hypothetical protein
MSLTKVAILESTHNGLDVFRHFIPGHWKVGRNFLNPLYEDKKASCHIYLDKKSKVYKIKDFGLADFSGDCFFLVGYLFHKRCDVKEEFIEILQIINSALSLCMNASNNIIPVHLPVKQQRPSNDKQVEDDYQKLYEEAFHEPQIGEFTESEISFWARSGITPAILSLYNTFSLVCFEGKGRSGNSFRIPSTEAEPIFGYVALKHTKLYRPFSNIRFLYSGALPQGYVFGLEQLPTKGDILFITGGEKDVMSLAAKGFSAICFNSETSTISKVLIKRLSFRFKHIVLLYDSDPVGLEASLKQCDFLSEFDVKRLVLPLCGSKTEKDISDFFALGHTHDDLMRLFSEMLEKLYEETMAILKSCEVDFDNPPIRPEPMITIKDITIGSPGNILCITGSEGSGKSNYLSGIISGAIGEQGTEIDSLGAEIRRNINEKAVLFYDTEQSEDQLFKNFSFTLKRAHRNRPPKWFKAYCMVGMSRKDRMQCIMQSIDKFYYEFGGIHLVVIDGIADLIDGVNDEQKSVQLVEELFRLAGIYKTLIVVVLHLSPSGIKLRGHLGSEIQRKAAGILSIEKDDNNMSVVKALKVRDGSPLDVPLVQFGWDKEKNHHVYFGEKAKDAQDQRKLEDLSEIAKEIFGRKPFMSYQELVAALMDSLGVRDRQAKNYIKYMKDSAIIEKGGSQGTEFALVETPF